MKKAGGLQNLLQRKLTIIKKQYWSKDWDRDQQSRIQSPEINSSVCDQLTFNISAKEIQWE
jgi:hypothetical protein